MQTLRILLVTLAVTAGCGKQSAHPQHIQAWVNSWAEMGMYLPDKEQVDFLRANLSDVQAELEAAVAHENSDVRQRAAYVIGNIGPDANALGVCLFEQLKAESVQIVQIYLVDALAGIRFKNNEVLEFLTIKYISISDKNVSSNLFGAAYAEVDEKINLAGVLYALSEVDERDQYLDFVVQWLEPLEEDSPESAGYWERRWMAVNTLEAMEDASAAIPMLDAMLKERNAKPWVAVHVPRVLAALKGE